MYISPAPAPASPAFALKRGPERSPFYASLRGLLFLRLGEGPFMYKVYIVPGDTTGAPHFGQQRGPERSPFLTSPAGLLTSSTWPVKQERITGYFWTQGPPFCKYFSRPPVASYSNPKKSQSRRLLHSCIVLCVLAYVLCFLGALACGLFLKKTHSG